MSWAGKKVDKWVAPMVAVMGMTWVVGWVVWTVAVKVDVMAELKVGKWVSQTGVLTAEGMDELWAGLMAGLMVGMLAAIWVDCLAGKMAERKVG